MEKTRFKELTQSELYLLETLVSASAEKMNKKFDENINKLIKEIQQQIYINEWSKKEIEIKKTIGLIQDKINILKNQLIVEVDRKKDLEKLLNK
jgi:peptide deformylase